MILQLRYRQWFEQQVKSLAATTDDQQWLSTLILLTDELKRDPKQKRHQDCKEEDNV